MNPLESLESWLSPGLPSAVEEEAEACFRSFDVFAQRAWGKLERDTRILWEPVHEAIALHVQALVHGFVREKLYAFAQGFAHGRLPRVSTERLPLGKKEREAELRERARLAHIWAVGRRLEVLLENGQVVHRPQSFTKLLVNVGTGMGKSKLACVMAPAYLWLLWPSAVEQSFSVNPRGAAKEAGAQLEVVSGDWWRSTFRLWWGLELAHPAASNYSNTAGGQRVALGWGAQAQGDHAHFQMIDDPEDPKKVFSDGERASTQLAWDTKIVRRVIPGGTSITLAVQQGLEAEDWSRYVLRTGQWEHLELATEAMADASPCECPTHKRGHTLVIDPKTGQGWRDCRKPGELIAPRLVPPKEVAARKATPAVWIAQDQQRPKSLSGNIFPEAGWWFWRFKEEPEAETEEMRKRTLVIPPREEWEEFFKESLLMSVDPSLGTQSDGSLDCMGVWGVKGQRHLLLDCEWDAMTMRQARRAMRNLLKRNPNVGPKLVEKAVQGPGIVDSLTESGDFPDEGEADAEEFLPGSPEGDVAELVKGEEGEPAVEGIILVQTKGSKVWRAISIQHLHAAGNIVLPLHHPKRPGMVRETKAFPKKGVRNDFVDMMSQALRYRQEKKRERAKVGGLYQSVAWEE